MMARADLLVKLIKAAGKRDDAGIRRIAEGIIAEERENKHHILADRLASALRENGETPIRPGRILDNGIAHLLHHKVPERRDRPRTDSVIPRHSIPAV